MTHAEDDEGASDDCENCNATMTLRDGDEPTPNCDRCAQELLAAAQARIAELERERDIAKAHERELRPIADDYLKGQARADRAETALRNIVTFALADAFNPVGYGGRFRELIGAGQVVLDEAQEGILESSKQIVLSLLSRAAAVDSRCQVCGSPRTSGEHYDGCALAYLIAALTTAVDGTALPSLDLEARKAGMTARCEHGWDRNTQALYDTGACPQCLFAAQARMARTLREIRRDDTPWPLEEVLRRLVDATKHLLTVHACDTHGHEGIRDAMLAGEDIIAGIVKQREGAT